MFSQYSRSQVLFPFKWFSLFEVICMMLEVRSASSECTKEHTEYMLVTLIALHSSGMQRIWYSYDIYIHRIFLIDTLGFVKF